MSDNILNLWQNVNKEFWRISKLRTAKPKGSH